MRKKIMVSEVFPKKEGLHISCKPSLSCIKFYPWTNT